ncbi:DUF4030 domain-containing protein [Peribacillus psychrosaccharolyticus]|uniref:DUF4030 domain-containing protein n=1 Tax=Peribacillus psychrosaccharolyticus TaxID=1407 RepID=UPI003D2B0D06
MNDYLSNNVKKEVDKIKIPEVKLDQAIENAIKRGKKKKRSLGKKVIYFSSAAVLLFGLLIGSAFVSPAMAKVISNIPYLGSVFQSEPISGLIFDELKEKGYKISGTGTTYSPHKIFHVTLEGSDDYYNEVKDEVKQTVREILKSKGYDAYTVEVTKVRKDYVLNNEEMNEKNIIETAVTKELKQKNYKFDRVQTDPTEKTIFINIVGSKKYYNSVQDDVEKMALEVADGNAYTSYKINVTRVTVEIRKSDKGAQITSTIAEGLMSKKEFKVTGVGYKSKPLSFIISTSILSSDPKAQALGTEIESMIVEFLKSEEILTILDKEPYEIIVKSKDKKKINP